VVDNLDLQNTFVNNTKRLWQKIAFAASMFSVVSLLYVLGILAKPNFKVHESKKALTIIPCALRVYGLSF
jgi:hypothetical protein